MKKFFSIVCALAIVLSASAVPAKQLRGFAKMSKDDFAKQQVEKPAVKQAKTLQLAPVALKNVPAAKAATKHVPAAQLAPSTIKHAPAAKLNTYNVAIEEYSADFLEEDNDLYFQMFDATGDYAFTVDVVLPAGETELTLGQTYTNMLLDYTRAYQYDETEEDYLLIDKATAASLIMTEDLEGLVRIEVTMTLDNGDIYNLVYQEEPLPVATDTINVVFAAEEVTLTDYSATNGIFQFFGMNAGGAVYAAFYGDQIAGTYTNDQLYLNYTAIYQFGATDTTYVAVLAGDAVITFANDTFHLSAYYLGEDAHCYHVQMAYYEEPFVPTGDTINVVITEPMMKNYYASKGDWWLRGENAEYGAKIDVVNNDPSSPAGTYTLADALKNYTYITDKATDTKINLVDFEAVVTDANNRIDVVANMLCEDGNVYHVTMFYQAPEAQYFDTIVATNLAIEEQSLYGYILGYTATASDANYEVYFSLDSIEDGAYAASGSIENIATGVASKVYSGSIVLATAADGSRTITGDVLCENNTQYTLNLTYIKPTPTSSETLNAAGVLYLLQQNDMYYWQAAAKSADATRYISLVAITDGNDAGTYTTDDMYASYTYAGKFINNDTAWYVMIDANFTLAINNDVATITGTFLGQNESNSADVVEFTLNLTLQVNDERNAGDQYDNSEYDFVEHFATYTVDDQYLAQYGDLIIKATNENGARVGLDMYIGEGESTLTPGEYTISDSEDPMTLYPGGCDGSNVYYSFFGYTNGEGYITNMWFPVSGSVIVSESGVISIDALNSYGKRIVVQLGEWPEAIENTEAEANVSKRIENGQLIIIKNGVKYNAVGTVVK